ncbi:hypothetical protein OSB04_031444 [Centaurea solstitialis]|uniref:Uncharacterized protein n=1 Tax=Centaurea solstitialis TaxID=347529 RepID=A0AA38SMM9_9ASTR|nr:hypothetical protein OSB04_031444 [Centaurea solstitialis]
MEERTCDEGFDYKVSCTYRNHDVIWGKVDKLTVRARGCVCGFFGESWDTYLPLAEFLYNNSFHASISMPPYEMWCERRCRTSIYRGEIGYIEIRFEGSCEFRAFDIFAIQVRPIREKKKEVGGAEEEYCLQMYLPIDTHAISNDIDNKLKALEEIASFIDHGKLVVIFIDNTEPTKLVIPSNEDRDGKKIRIRWGNPKPEINGAENGFKNVMIKLHHSRIVKTIVNLIETKTTEKQTNKMNGGFTDILCYPQEKI